MAGASGHRPLCGGVSRGHAIYAFHGCADPGMGCTRDLYGRSSRPSSAVDQQRSRLRRRGRITLGGTVHAVLELRQGIYGVCVQRQRRTPRSSAIVATAVAAVLTPALVVVPALAMQFVVWDPKWPVILVMWAPANLLVTCLAEETFFRGILQRHLAEALRARIPLALAGVLLYGVCVQRQRRTPRSSAIVATAVAAVLTPALVVVPALAMQFVVWDPKWPVILVMWAPANLLVTCLAEETFFRGILQRHLAEALRARIPLAGLVALRRGSGVWYCTYCRWHCLCRPGNARRHRLRRSLPRHTACRSKHTGALHPEFGALDVVYLPLRRIGLKRSVVVRCRFLASEPVQRLVRSDVADAKTHRLDA